MPDPIADYDRAADGFAAVLAGCGEDLSAPSPCPEWRAQDVVDHVLGGTAHFTNLFGGAVPDVDGPLPDRYGALRAAIVEAVQAPGAVDKPVPSPIGGELPAGVMFGIFTTDTLLHTWDLAKALGQDVELDPELLERSWQNALPLTDAIRGPGLFGPELAVAEDAPMQAKALAFFGRAS